jgi:acyl carrier protein
VEEVDEKPAQSIRSLVIAQFQQVAEEQQRTLAPLTDDLPLLDSGLDSLCFAVVVTRLEDALGVDPFSTLEGEDRLPVTLRDFIRLYEDAAS